MGDQRLDWSRAAGCLLVFAVSLGFWVIVIWVIADWVTARLPVV